MTAFADTVVFMTIIMMAISVSVLTSLSDEEGKISPYSFLGMVSSTELRLSDMTDLEDDALIHLPDAMAYSIEHESPVSAYLESILNSTYGPGRYCLSYSYGEKTATIGEPHRFFKSCSSLDCAVSVGGYLSMRLEVYA